MTETKLLGSLFLLGAAAGGLVKALLREQRRSRVLRDWIDRMVYIRRQIDLYLSPLNDIMVSLGFHDGKNALPRLLRENAEDLSPEAHRILLQVTEGLGRGYREEQIRLCNYALSELQTLYEKQQSEKPSRMRVMTALWVSMPLCLVILLW